MQPHYSHSSRENATPSSGTSPLASCKGVAPRAAKVGEILDLPPLLSLSLSLAEISFTRPLVMDVSRKLSGNGVVF